MRVAGTSPRHEVLKNLQNIVTKDAAGAQSHTEDTIPLPALGDMQLFSFWKPALEAGTFTINVSQDVVVTQNPDENGNTTSDTKHLPVSLDESQVALQTFEVVAPQFTIDSKDIHSTYPPQGHADQPSVLPHIVFNDAHLPWERGTPGISRNTSDPNEDANPWLAVFPFDCNAPDPANQELRLTPDQLMGGNSVYSKLGSDGNNMEVKQSAAFTISMSVAEYLALPTAAPIPAPSPSEPARTTRIRIPPFQTDDPDYGEISALTTPVEVVFLSGKLFKQLFHDPTSGKIDLSSFRRLAHVRNVNTAGMAQASAQDEESGLVSIVHSKRTGPTDIAPNCASRPQIVHLISLEYVEWMEDSAAIKDTDLVAFISLYHWSYLCQPPATVNFVDSMRDIGEQIIKKDTSLRVPSAVLEQVRVQAMLAAADSALNLADEKIQKLQTAIYERLENGYSIARYRTASGEETVAYTRGPLIPTSPPPVPSDWPYNSSFGQDYQIFDKNLGIIDISYSSAWQLGKVLAISDSGFVAALMRVRRVAHFSGMRGQSMFTKQAQIGAKTKLAVLKNLSSTVSSLNLIAKSSSPNQAPIPGLRQRWSNTGPISIDLKNLGTDGKLLASHAFIAGVQRQIIVTSSAVGDEDANFNETNLAASSDWAYIHSWILDRMWLSQIPTHYYLGDPSYLPPESIRFFQVDPAWIECLIDGALSVANHMARDDDHVRTAIKSSLNNYFDTPFRDKEGEPLHYPQVPRYGFFLRSAVVTIFPDLVLSIPFADESQQNGRAPILLQKHLGTDILFVLLDRAPEELKTMKISQPPHQQRFSAGDLLDGNYLEFLFRKLYRDVNKDTGKIESDFFHEFGGPQKFYRPGHEPAAGTDVSPNQASVTISEEPVYDWDTRCLNMNVLEKYLLGQDGLFVKEMPAEWGMGTYQLSSAMAGLLLNDTIKYIEIKGPSYDNPTPSTQVPYKLRIRPNTELQNKTAQIFANFKTAKSAPLGSQPQMSHSASVPTTVQKIAALSPSSSVRASARLSSSVPRHLSRVIATSESSLQKLFNLIPPDPALVTPTMHDTAFQYAIFPSSCPYIAPPVNSAPGANSWCHLDSPYIPDLIFSINIKPAWVKPLQVPDPAHPGQKKEASMWLSSVTFTIPVGNPSRRRGSKDIQGAGLVPDNAACGLHGHTLTNQRWIVHLDPGSEYMVVRLIPRSTRLATPVEWNRSLSFKLDEVDLGGLDAVSQTAKPVPGIVNIDVKEEYGFYDSGGNLHSQGSASVRLQVPRVNGFPDWRPPNLK